MTMAIESEARTAVEKAFSLLEAWEHRDETLGVSELSRRTGLPKTTSHRLLGVLESAGIVERSARSYRIGQRLRGITGLLTGGLPPQLREACLPFLQDLYELTHETVHLGVLTDSGVQCVEKLHGHRRSPANSRVGGALPAHSTAVGKALLAYASGPARTAVLSSDLPRYTAATITSAVRLQAELTAVRRAGIAYDFGETHPEAVCVAAPVLGSGGQAVAAVSISGHITRFEPGTVIDRLRRAARAASAAMAAARPDAA
jgi:IclR family KDG regulon transcriptional repressor